VLEIFQESGAGYGPTTGGEWLNMFIMKYFYNLSCVLASNCTEKVDSVKSDIIFCFGSIM